MFTTIDVLVTDVRASHTMNSNGQQQQQSARLDNDETSSENIIDYTSTSEDDVTSRSPVLKHRHWVHVTDHRVNSVLHSSEKLIRTTASHAHESTARFRVATYNILSDNAIEADEYLYCPSQLRYMSSRHQRIIAEIRNMQPHLICFQVSWTYMYFTAAYIAKL